MSGTQGRLSKNKLLQLLLLQQDPTHPLPSAPVAFVPACVRAYFAEIITKTNTSTARSGIFRPKKNTICKRRQTHTRLQRLATSKSCWKGSNQWAVSSRCTCAIRSVHGNGRTIQNSVSDEKSLSGSHHPAYNGPAVVFHSGRRVLFSYPQMIIPQPDDTPGVINSTRGVRLTGEWF